MFLSLSLSLSLSLAPPLPIRGPRPPHTSHAGGLLRELNPGPLGPKPRIIPLDQAADGIRRLRGYGEQKKRRRLREECAHKFIKSRMVFFMTRAVAGACEHQRATFGAPRESTNEHAHGGSRRRQCLRRELGGQSAQEKQARSPRPCVMCVARSHAQPTPCGVRTRDLWLIRPSL